MGSRPRQRIHDLIEMPLRIGVRARIPRRLLAVNRLPIQQRRHLAVAGPQVKADSATVQMPPQRGGEVPFGGQLAGLFHEYFKRPFINLFPHDPRVKAPGGRIAIMLLQLRPQLGGPSKVNSVSAPRPEQEFEQPLPVRKTALLVWRGRRCDDGFKARNRTIRPFQRDLDR